MSQSAVNIYSTKVVLKKLLERLHYRKICDFVYHVRLLTCMSHKTTGEHAVVFVCGPTLCHIADGRPYETNAYYRVVS